MGLEARLVVLSMYSIKGVDVMGMYWCFVGGICCGVSLIQQQSFLAFVRGY